MPISASNGGWRTLPNRQVRLTRFQLWLVGFESFLLVATVLATAMAACAAASAAQSARKSVEVSEKTAERQLRAYLSMKTDALGGLHEGTRIRVQFQTLNHGETPAYDLWHEFGMGVFPLPAPPGFELPKRTITIHPMNAIYPDSTDDFAWSDGPSTKRRD